MAVDPQMTLGEWTAIVSAGGAVATIMFNVGASGGSLWALCRRIRVNAATAAKQSQQIVDSIQALCNRMGNVEKDVAQLREWIMNRRDRDG